MLPPLAMAAHPPPGRRPLAQVWVQNMANKTCRLIQLPCHRKKGFTLQNWGKIFGYKICVAGGRERIFGGGHVEPFVSILRSFD